LGGGDVCDPFFVIHQPQPINLDIYKFAASDTFLDFEFESNGPKGKVRKIVRYSPQNAGGITYFNLGFGDLNSKTGKIDDLAITNNRDRTKILATIAATVLEFTQHFPDVMVYAKGRTSTIRPFWSNAKKS
jgi:hypothetical protein